MILHARNHVLNARNIFFFFLRDYDNIQGGLLSSFSNVCSSKIECPLKEKKKKHFYWRRTFFFHGIPKIKPHPLSRWDKGNLDKKRILALKRHNPHQGWSVIRATRLESADRHLTWFIEEEGLRFRRCHQQYFSFLRAKNFLGKIKKKKYILRMTYLKILPARSDKWRQRPPSLCQSSASGGYFRTKRILWSLHLKVTKKSTWDLIRNLRRYRVSEKPPQSCKTLLLNIYVRVKL